MAIAKSISHGGFVIRPPWNPPPPVVVRWNQMDPFYLDDPRKRKRHSLNECRCVHWSERRDLNPRPPDPQFICIKKMKRQIQRLLPSLPLFDTYSDTFGWESQIIIPRLKYGYEHFLYSFGFCFPTFILFPKTLDFCKSGFFSTGYVVEPRWSPSGCIIRPNLFSSLAW